MINSIMRTGKGLASCPCEAWSSSTLSDTKNIRTQAVKILGAHVKLLNDVVYSGDRQQRRRQRLKGSKEPKVGWEKRFGVEVGGKMRENDLFMVPFTLALTEDDTRHLGWWGALGT